MDRDQDVGFVPVIKFETAERQCEAAKVLGRSWSCGRNTSPDDGQTISSKIIRGNRQATSEEGTKEIRRHLVYSLFLKGRYNLS